MVGQVTRDLLEENVSKYDPFNRQRKEKFEFYDKSKGSPFAGVTMENLNRFIENKEREFKLKSRD